MNSSLLVTTEILVVVVAPLLFLYLRGPWSLRSAVPCLLTIPLLWYLTYAPIHELSHVAGTYLVGAKVTYVKLIPSFWNGEFGRAWITPEGITKDWQRLLMTSSPYLLDVVSAATGLLVLRRERLTSAFLLSGSFSCFSA